jgi:hypothetical protein
LAFVYDWHLVPLHVPHQASLGLGRPLKAFQVAATI